MSKSCTSGLAGFEDRDNTDDPVEDLQAALRKRHVREGISLRPVTPTDIREIEEVYWPHWMHLETGIDASEWAAARVHPRPEVRARMRPHREAFIREFKPATTNGLSIMAERNGEMLCFTLSHSPHDGVMEGLDLYAKESARNIGLPATLIGRSLDLGKALGYSVFMGLHADTYFDGKTLAPQYQYLKLGAKGWHLTPHLNIGVFTWDLGNPRRHSDPNSMSGLPRTFMRSGKRARVDLAYPEHAEQIAALSQRLPGARPFSKYEVELLLDRGPACVAIGNNGDGVVGYGLSSMFIHGVLEITGLGLDATRASGETEAEILTFLHRGARVRNAHIAIVVDSGGKTPIFTRSFGPAFAEVGFIDHFHLGNDEGPRVLARDLSEGHGVRPSPLTRYRRIDDVSRMKEDPYRSVLMQPKPSLYSYLDDPGEVLGRDPEAVGFTSARPVTLDEIKQKMRSHEQSPTVSRAHPNLYGLP